MFSVTNYLGYLSRTSEISIHIQEEEQKSKLCDQNWFSYQKFFFKKKRKEKTLWDCQSFLQQGSADMNIWN